SRARLENSTAPPSFRSDAARPGSNREALYRAIPSASASSRTVPSATERPIGKDKSHVWLWAENAEARAIRRRRAGLPGIATPARLSPARRWSARRNVFASSFLCHRFIQIEYLARHRGVRGQFGHLQLLVARRLTYAHQLQRGFWIRLILIQVMLKTADQHAGLLRRKRARCGQAESEIDARRRRR